MQKRQIITPYSYWSNIIYHLKTTSCYFSMYNYFEEQRDMKAKVPLSIETINPIQALTGPGALLQADIPL